MAALLRGRLLCLPACVAPGARAHPDKEVKSDHKAPLVLTLCCVSPPAAEAATGPHQRFWEQRWHRHRPHGAQVCSSCGLLWSLRGRGSSAAARRSKRSGQPNGEPDRTTAGGGDPKDLKSKPGAVNATPAVWSKTGPPEAGGPCGGAARWGSALRS